LHSARIAQIVPSSSRPSLPYTPFHLTNTPTPLPHRNYEFPRNSKLSTAEIWILTQRMTVTSFLWTDLHVMWRAALLDKLLPCSWLSNVASEVWRLRLRSKEMCKKKKNFFVYFNFKLTQFYGMRTRFASTNAPDVSQYSTASSQS